MTRSDDENRLADCCAILLGALLTLVVRGYQFGQSNHTIYLLDALRVNDPRLLANDWFVTHTYQYHFVFAHVTAWLFRVGIVRPAFFVGYLLLIVAWQVAWLRLVRAVGGSRQAYVLSVVLFTLSAGGVGLGMYDFLQDASFLPSNIANVAMLWGIYWWIVNRPAAAGIAFGIAGFFHLNHAVVCVGLWVVLVGFELIWGGSGDRRRWLAGTVALLALCLPNVVPAARVALTLHTRMPLEDFVDLYVRLRHPHHYDPSSWPIALWVSFLWPFPLAILCACAKWGPTMRRAAVVFLLLCGVVGFGLIFAGLWYVSETIVQMSLARFSIYLKLFSCMGAAIWLVERAWSWRTQRIILVALALVGPLAFALVPRLAVAAPTRGLLVQNGTMLALLWLTLVIGAGFAFRLPAPLPGAARAGILGALAFIVLTHVGGLGLHLGFEKPDPPAYLAVCDFAREHTPTDAVFLVPPSEEQFRLQARRAIVVNFKGVPQFSGEVVEWRRRLCYVLGMSDLTALPHRFDRTLDAISQAYDRLPPDDLSRVAEAYHARYVVTSHGVDLPPPAVSVFESGGYHLYDLNP